MYPQNLRRWAGISGLTFIPLLVAAIVVVIPAPTADKSTTKIVDWFVNHRELALTSGALTVLSTLAFLWFLGYLHHAVSVDHSGSGLGSVVLASGLYTVTVATVSALPPALIAVLVNRPGVAPNASLIHTLSDFTNLSIALIGVGLAVFLASVGLLLAEGVLRPRWASWVAYIGAGLTVVGGVAGFYVSEAGKANPVSFLGLIGTAFFLVVVAALSVDVIRTSGSKEAATGARTPMPAPS